jgi:hypothetical protein
MTVIVAQLLSGVPRGVFLSVHQPDEHGAHGDQARKVCTMARAATRKGDVLHVMGTCNDSMQTLQTV